MSLFEQAQAYVRERNAYFAKIQDNASAIDRHREKMEDFEDGFGDYYSMITKNTTDITELSRRMDSTDNTLGVLTSLTDASAADAPTVESAAGAPTVESAADASAADVSMATDGAGSESLYTLQDFEGEEVYDTYIGNEKFCNTLFFKDTTESNILEHFPGFKKTFKFIETEKGVCVSSKIEGYDHFEIVYPRSSQEFEGMCSDPLMKQLYAVGGKRALMNEDKCSAFTTTGSD